MSKKTNKAMIGAFVVGSVVLLIIGIVVFGSGVLFKHTTRYVLYFDGSVKGLSVGAPVIFRGVKIGTVKDISLVYDQNTKNLLIPVIIEIEPSRVKGAPERWTTHDYGALISQGLKARLEIQSFITGQLMISFDFYPGRPMRLLGVIKEYPELPTLPISPDIFEIMEEIPLKDISKNLNETVLGINKLVNAEELRDSFSELKATLIEVTQAARSLHLLAEYLEQHPEAFLKGKSIPKGEHNERE